VWPGKYDENGKRREPPRVSLPFQVIERVNAQNLIFAHYQGRSNPPRGHI